MIKNKRWIFGLLGAVLIAAGAFCYYYSLPEQRAERLYVRAENAMQELRFEEAEQIYDEILMILPEEEPALKGKISALFGRADALADSAELSDRTAACGLYREIIQIEEEHGFPEESEGAGGYDGNREDGAAEKQDTLKEANARKKLTALEEKIAAAFESVSFETVRQDRSEAVMRPDGTEVPFIWYYDLVQVTDDSYPYSERINSVLRQQMDAFFSGSLPGSDKNPPAAAAGQSGEDDYRDYVGEAGVYSENGLLSIRMAHVRAQGKSIANYYCGMTFRLSDAEPLLLMDVVGRNDPGLKKLVQRRLWTFLKEQGYRSVSRDDVEKYVESTEPENFQFCIRNDGEVCLVIDQQIPFFSFAQEVLEIPLE